MTGKSDTENTKPTTSWSCFLKITHTLVIRGSSIFWWLLWWLSLPLALLGFAGLLASKHFIEQKETDMRYVPYIVVFICIVLMWSMAFANERTVNKDVEAEMLAYIAENTGYDVSGIVPHYAYWPREKINRTYYGDRFGGQTNIIALHIEGTIVLPSDGDVDWEANPEILLHELFHHVVFIRGIEFECIQEEERHAYELHMKYVDERRGGNGIKPSPFFMLFLQCDPPYYGRPQH